MRPPIDRMFLGRGDIARIGDLGGDTRDRDAPARMGSLVDIVDLEGNHGVPQRIIETSPRRMRTRIRSSETWKLTRRRYGRAPEVNAIRPRVRCDSRRRHSALSRTSRPFRSSSTISGSPTCSPRSSRLPSAPGAAQARYDAH